MTTDRGSYSGLVEGAPVYGQNGDQIGTVKEVRGRYFKVNAPMQPDYWLRTDAISSGSGSQVMLRFDRDRLGEYTVANPDDDDTSTGTATRTDNLNAYDTAQTQTATRDTGAAQPRMTEQTHSTTGDVDTDERRRVELREEELRAQKERVQVGEVGIRKEVVEEQRTVEVPVTREEVVVERHAVNRRPADGPIGEGETIDVPLTEERARLEKETVVTGEVEVGKRQVQETEQLTGTVRREEARVEREGDVQMRGDTDRNATRDRLSDNDTTTRR